MSYSFSFLRGMVMVGIVVQTIFALSQAQAQAQAQVVDCEETQANLAGAFPQFWGIDEHSTRFVSSQHTSINETNVHRLELKWAYGLETNSPRSY
ncbi:MAG: glucose dehydrogenase, partial [Candidatus Azotimanducaceae bacterium]